MKVLALLAGALSAVAANACILHVRVACPNDRTAKDIEVCIDGIGCVPTDELGIATFLLPEFGTYKVCVNEATLPPGATLSPSCVRVKVETDAPPVVEVALGGDFCSTPPPEGDCWLTGGGTVDKTRGVPNYSFGGVVYPGCSPNAAEGGNWNVIDHFTGLHFQGQRIIVDGCSGDDTQSPRVNVNIIDFQGTGIVHNLDYTPVEVSFTGRAVDNREPGGGNDLLFIRVTLNGNVVMQIGASAQEPATISTGNLQIHTSSCHN